MKEKFIEWFTSGNSGYAPAIDADGKFEKEKTQHMWEAYQAGLAIAEAQVKQLAAENAVMKSAIFAINKTAEECELNGDELRYVVGSDEFDHLTDLIDIEHRAIDAAIAALRAEGVEMLLTYLPPHYTARADIEDFAAHLRSQSEQVKGVQ